MRIQLKKTRNKLTFLASELSADGSFIGRKRNSLLVVTLPATTEGVAKTGTVWNIEVSRTESVSYERNGMPIHEERIEAESASFCKPSGELLIRWMVSAIEGLGEVKASRLVRADFDIDQAVRDSDIDKLTSVQGISPALASDIINFWPSLRFYNALRWLEDSGLPLKLASILARVYLDDVVFRLQDDPFLLTSFGVSFDRILVVIDKLKLNVSDDRKLAAIAEVAMKDACSSNGSTVVSEEKLKEHAKGLCKRMGVEVDDLTPAALAHGVVLQCDTGYQLIGSAIQEATVAKFLHDCANRKAGSGSLLAGWEQTLTDETILQALADFEDTLPFSMTDEQRQAVIGVVKSNFAVISGGAGTGKTTILLAVLHLYEALSKGMSMQLVALSGRAAQRMSEATGREAMTIARLIANHVGDSMPDLPEHCLLVVDEASMVDLLSMYKLVGLLPYATRVLLVGDAAQLPPVGSGLVFHACMLHSPFNVFELTQVKRQGEDSGIHKLATAIRNSAFDESLLNSVSGDVKYLSDSSERSITDAYFNAGGAKKAIVLTPVRKGILGVKAINRLIQSKFDCEQPDVIHYEDPLHGWTRWLTASDRELRLNDQVMVTANDYEEDIRNGDLGTITEVYESPVDGAFGELEIDGRTIAINYAVLEKLELGYAITIHKSQGSQWHSCIQLLPSYAQQMLDQTLLYTAVTRSAKELIILGDKNLIWSALERGASIYERNTNLAERLRLLTEN